MSVEYFLDTNILVYAHDAGDPRKRTIAQRLITDGLTQGHTALSAQVLSEFFVTATRKLSPPLPVDAVTREIELLSHLFVVSVDAPLVAEAIELLGRYSLNYWDALIIAAALRAGCRILFSEDLSHGQRYDAVEVQNPFV